MDKLSDLIFGINIQLNKMSAKNIDNKKVDIEIEIIQRYVDELSLIKIEKKIKPKTNKIVLSRWEKLNTYLNSIVGFLTLINIVVTIVLFVLIVTE